MPRKALLVVDEQLIACMHSTDMLAISFPGANGKTCLKEGKVKTDKNCVNNLVAEILSYLSPGYNEVTADDVALAEMTFGSEIG